MKALPPKFHCLFLAAFILVTNIVQAQYWRPVAGQIAGARFTGIAANTSSPAIVAATLNAGIYRSVDSGDSWQHVFAMQDSIFSLADIDGKHLCAGGKGFTYTSADSGITWASHVFPVPVAVGRLAVHPSGALVAGTGSKWDLGAGNTGKGVWLSLDTGKTWTAINNGITKQNPLIEALAITSSGTVLAGVYDNNIGLSGKYGIMKLDSFTGTWQRVSVSVNAPFNQTYSDQNLRIESVFNINIIDEQVVASIGGSYVNFGYAFSITKPVQDIDNANSAWRVKWVQDSLPGAGSFYEHLTNLFKDSHDTIWASVSSSGNEINNSLYTSPLLAAEPWSLTMDSITEQTGRFLFAEAAHGRLYSLSYFTGSQVFVRATASGPVAVKEIPRVPENNWQLFPNPATTYVQLRNPTNSPVETLRITMYDALGNKLGEQHINQQNQVIPLSDKLPAGLYVLSIGNEKEQQILRLVKTD